MKEEENVYVETDGAEETEAVSKVGADRREADGITSAVPGKFQDVNALARAYGALQAEFTRRSQRLRELERTVENFERGELGAARSGAEKLRKNAKARREETKRFDEFMAMNVEVGARETEEKSSETEPAVEVGQPSEQTPLEAVIEENGPTVYEMSVTTGEAMRLDKGEDKTEKGEQTLPSVAMSGNAAGSSESLYEMARRDEEVRLKIIGEYLSSLGRSGAPLMTGGVGAMATPPRKPASISEAGNMALLYFKKPNA